MNRVIGTAVCLLMVVVVLGCARMNPAAPPEPKPVATRQAVIPAEKPGELQVGQANGSYTAKGQVVELKYAYAKLNDLEKSRWSSY